MAWSTPSPSPTYTSPTSTIHRRASPGSPPGNRKLHVPGQGRQLQAFFLTSGTTTTSSSTGT